MFLDREKISQLASENGYVISETAEGVRFRNQGSTILITVKPEGPAYNVSVDFQTDLYHSTSVERPRMVRKEVLISALSTAMKRYADYSNNQTMMV